MGFELCCLPEMPAVLRALAGAENSIERGWQQLEAAKKHPEGSFKVINALAMAGSCGEPSSHQTHRWSKADSNPRSCSCNVLRLLNAMK
jgi:hypothetical protein